MNQISDANNMVRPGQISPKGPESSLYLTNMFQSIVQKNPKHFINETITFLFTTVSLIPLGYSVPFKNHTSTKAKSGEQVSLQKFRKKFPQAIVCGAGRRSDISGNF